MGAVVDTENVMALVKVMTLGPLATTLALPLIAQGSEAFTKVMVMGSDIVVPKPARELWKLTAYPSELVNPPKRAVGAEAV